MAFLNTSHTKNPVYNIEDHNYENFLSLNFPDKIKDKTLIHYDRVMD